MFNLYNYFTIITIMNELTDIMYNIIRFDKAVKIVNNILGLTVLIKKKLFSIKTS